MNPYRRWSDRYHASKALLLPKGLYPVGGHPSQVAWDLTRAFPELDVVEGEVWIEDHIYSHVWCVVRETGEIVDPSGERFGVVNAIGYIPKV